MYTGELVGWISFGTFLLGGFVVWLFVGGCREMRRQEDALKEHARNQRAFYRESELARLVEENGRLRLPSDRTRDLAFVDGWYARERMDDSALRYTLTRITDALRDDTGHDAQRGEG